MEQIVYVNWHPVYERVICVHETQDGECPDCIKAREETTKGGMAFEEARPFIIKKP